MPDVIALTGLCERRPTTEVAWGEHLREFAWSHVVHLTSESETFERRIMREFTDRFIRKLARRVRHRIPYFVAVEEHVSRHPHLHALIGGTEQLCVRAFDNCWVMGFMRVTRYDPRGGATFYVAKTIRSGADNYAISKRMPPRVANTPR